MKNGNSTIGSRLRIAINNWQPVGGSIRSFQREAELISKKRHINGASYPMIHRYLKDKAVPSVRFLRVAAELLEVREAWLICDEGDRTEIEDSARQLGRERPFAVDGWADEVDVLFQAILRRLLASCVDAPQITNDNIWEVRSLLFDMLFAPLTSLQTEEYSNVFQSLGAMSDYLIATLHAIGLAIPEPRTGRPIAELSKASR